MGPYKFLLLTSEIKPKIESTCDWIDKKKERRFGCSAILLILENRSTQTSLQKKSVCSRWNFWFRSNSQRNNSIFYLDSSKSLLQICFDIIDELDSC
jgi:hypothetical protein